MRFTLCTFWHKKTTLFLCPSLRKSPLYLLLSPLIPSHTSLYVFTPQMPHRTFNFWYFCLLQRNKYTAFFVLSFNFFVSFLSPLLRAIVIHKNPHIFTTPLLVTQTPQHPQPSTHHPQPSITIHKHPYALHMSYTTIALFTFTGITRFMRFIHPC